MSFKNPATQYNQQARFSSTVDPEDLQPDNSFQKVFYEEPCEEIDALNLARTLFDLREYRKCASNLKPYASQTNQTCLFLESYALYMVSEQNLEEEVLESNGVDKVNCCPTVNKELTTIEQKLEPLYQNN
mmetsp:Transcript_5636/g.4029  ORF Transcript_5636/g.4029 Transcript_5636/m.4029 type:complete len:130 (+) Transcript_5636:292-681(+)|eukprot:CAMPEP_0116873090 /NCGR_PEP_ID=MMETSP0463-20121206/4068_1 /TAXON_ID=181622 /ORGANISM="Strombidinopsis sp, Strain SopsisLIS2011" /LENGTH=129 /DNA_ID=CAMNT_0004514419 /DNA_START=158 /DNA_END=547 /DNA_ORIENTATION=+